MLLNCLHRLGGSDLHLIQLNILQSLGDLFFEAIFSAVAFLVFFIFTPEPLLISDLATYKWPLNGPTFSGVNLSSLSAPDIISASTIVK